MNEQLKKEFTKFLKPRGMVGLILIGVFMILFALVTVAVEIPILMMLFFLAVGVVLLYLGLHTLLQYPGYIRSLEESGYMMQILQDYAQANSVMHNQLRFGNYHLYAKGQGKLLTYTEIVRVYQHIHKTNFVEDRRELRFLDRDGKEGTLCGLQLKGRSDADLRQVVGMLLQRNPSLQVGYHK